MKIFSQSLVLLSMFSSISSFAATLNYNPASTKQNGIELDVSATETVTGQNKILTNIGEGIRMEPVAGFNAKIYLAQFFAENPNAISRDPKTVAGSLNAAGMKALKITLILGLVTVDKIVAAFSNSLNQNIVTADEQAAFGADRDRFLDAVRAGGGIRKGSNITLFGYVKADGTEEIIFEGTNGNQNVIDSKSPGFVNKIFGIWLGNIDKKDDGLNDLKKLLLTDANLTPQS